MAATHLHLGLAVGQATIDFAFASICTIAPVARGESFTEDNIWVKRPGTGEILADSYHEVLGKIATEDIGADELLCITQVFENADHPLCTSLLRAGGRIFW